MSDGEIIYNLVMEKNKLELIIQRIYCEFGIYFDGDSDLHVFGELVFDDDKIKLIKELFEQVPPIKL